MIDTSRSLDQSAVASSVSPALKLQLVIRAATADYCSSSSSFVCVRLTIVQLISS